MKLFGCLLIQLLFFYSVRAQKISFTEQRSSSHTYVKGEDFEGVIFSKDFVFPFLANQSGDKRFTPTATDVEAAELLLCKNLKTVNCKKVNQGGGIGPVIDENLNKFVRQYYGYISDTGERIVYISCLIKSNYKATAKEVPNWLKGAVVVLNGGSNYWQVQANLNKASLFGLDINGLDRTASR